MKKFLLTLAALMLCACASACAEGVVINEVMSRNTMYAGVDGAFSGWVEVYNASD